MSLAKHASVPWSGCACNKVITDSVGMESFIGLSALAISSVFEMSVSLSVQMFLELPHTTPEIVRSFRTRYSSA